jgi:hypothetical protein
MFQKSGCCNVAMVCTHMLQASIPNVSSVFFRRMLQVCFIWMLHMFHIYVASVLSRCCICLQWFSSLFSRVFAGVSDICFKCFICLFFYIASIASKYVKSKSDVAHGTRVESERGASSPRVGTRCRRCSGGAGPVWAHDVRASWALARTRETRHENRDCSHRHPDAGVRPYVQTVVVPNQKL